MPIKKVKTEKDNLKEEKAEKAAKYFYAVGRRKTAIAQVKLFIAKGNQSAVEVNGKKMEEYFPAGRLKELVKAPLAMSGETKFDAVAKVVGGGVSAQAEAVRLGIARALVIFDAALKKSLKDKGFMTRDSREVERKKPGLKKARRAPQWAKR